MKHFIMIIVITLTTLISPNVYAQITVKNLTNKDFTISKEIYAQRENDKLTPTQPGEIYSIQNETFGSAGNIVTIKVTHSNGEIETIKKLQNVYIITVTYIEDDLFWLSCT